MLPLFRNIFRWISYILSLASNLHAAALSFDSILSMKSKKILKRCNQLSSQYVYLYEHDVVQDRELQTHDTFHLSNSDSLDASYVKDRSDADAKMFPWVPWRQAPETKDCLKTVFPWVSGRTGSPSGSQVGCPRNSRHLAWLVG